MSFEERRINLVKEHEFLYNTKSRTYKNSIKRAVAWGKISKSLNRPVQDCKQRWRSFRDRFLREHKNITSLPSGSGAVFDADDKWEHYDSLDFLIPSLITRKQIGNCEIETPVDVAEESGDIHISPPPIMSGTNVGSIDIECTHDNGITPKKSRANKRQVAEETFKNFMDGLNTTVSAHLNAPIPDVDMEFMQNMALKMKPLPESVKMHLHAGILGIINEELLHYLNYEN